MSCLRITGRCMADPPPAEWRAQLAARLGGKLRRLGLWAELGLYGALKCLAAAGEAKLPAHAGLILSSQHGPVTALHHAFEQACEDLPMPHTFLQTQPSQLLAGLALHLNWCGDARFMTHPDPRALLQLAVAQNHRDGFLIGWVEEVGAGRSVWLRLRPAAQPSAVVRQAHCTQDSLWQASHLGITAAAVTAWFDPAGSASGHRLEEN